MIFVDCHSNIMYPAIAFLKIIPETVHFAVVEVFGI